MSRHELLEWVNRTAQMNYKKIEELRSGVAYCQLMELLFPHCIGLKKVKMNAKLEHEFQHNLRLFQAAFLNLEVSKAVPIDRLIKGRFQDNFEFLQWFKKFYDSHGKENNNNVASLLPTASVKAQLREPLPREEKRRSVSPGGMQEKQEMQEIVELYTKQCDRLTEERNYYFNKLTDIETLLKESVEKNEHAEWSKRALETLYLRGNAEFMAEI